MSDYEQAIVDIDAKEAEIDALVKRVMMHLVTNRVVRLEPRVEMVVNRTVREYPAAPGADKAVKLKPGATPPSKSTLQHHGMVVNTDRDVLTAMENGLVLRCSSCKVELDLMGGSEEEAWLAWVDAVGVWQDGNDDASFACPRCETSTRLAEWDGPFPWGFGRLSLVFRNWPPLEERFVMEVAGVLGHRIRHVHVLI